MSSSHSERLLLDIEKSNKSLYQLFEDTAQRHGKKNCIDFLGKKLTYRQCHQFINKLAAGLQKHGINKGDPIGLMLPNGLYYLLAYYAIVKIGAVVVNLNPLLSQEDLDNQIKNSGLKMLFSIDLTAMRSKLDYLIQHNPIILIICPFTWQLPFIKKLGFCLLQHHQVMGWKTNLPVLSIFSLLTAPSHFRAVTINPHEDIAVLQYTGGTTGVSKAAMLTHTNIVTNTIQSASHFSMIPNGNSSVVGILPFFHSFGMTAVLNVAIYKAMTIIALPKFDISMLIEAFKRTKPQLFPGVPAIFSALLHHPSCHASILQSLLLCVAGGAPLPFQLKKDFEQKSGCPVVEGYGLTEASPVVSVTLPDENNEKTGSVGPLLPGTEAIIIDPDTKLYLQAGEKGEICLKGPQIMKGYWQNPEETNNVFWNGYLRTGDIGYLDEEGYLFVVDRLKDMIITAGYNVYPRKIEEKIHEHPAVQECLVAGIKHQLRGEIIKACICLKPNEQLTAAQLKEFLKSRLGEYEMPKQFDLSHAPLPRTAVGKLSRRIMIEKESSQ
ncbi:MAG: long-chain-fatty-acid--CoA ligase [Alphaproteobacteria bacterium]